LGTVAERVQEGKGRRLWRGLEVLLWIGVLAFVGLRVWPQLAAAVGVGGTGEPVPALEVVTLDGEPVSLDALRGQVVLVNFWATWCPPCRLEMPGFQRVYESRRDRGFTIVGLSTDRTGTGPVRQFLEERGITYPVAMAPGEAVRSFGGVTALPLSFLIDRSGRIRHEVRGYFAEPALARAVDRLLDEAPTEPVAAPAAEARTDGADLPGGP
jgi:peroxiredoxin